MRGLRKSGFVLKITIDLSTREAYDPNFCTYNPTS